MLMKLYKTTDRDNVIRKTLTNEVEYQIKFKDRADVRTPIIMLKSDTFIDSNYAYIPDFGRYYFIRNVQVFPNKIYQLTLRCDVLQSFMNDILNSVATIIKSENGNNYIDEKYVREVRKNVTTVDFEKPFKNYDAPEYILITGKGAV